MKILVKIFLFENKMLYITHYEERVPSYETNEKNWRQKNLENLKSFYFTGDDHTFSCDWLFKYVFGKK